MVSLQFRLIALALLISVPALAQPAPAPPTYELGKKEDIKDVDKVLWTAKGEAGLVATTGNSQSTTITVGADATRKDKDNKLEVVLAGAFARATTRVVNDTNGDGMIEADELSHTTATSAENAQVKLRYDRFLTGLDAFYAAALAATDRPAGKNFQGGGQVGYSRGLYQCEKNELLGEVGYDLSYLKLAAGSSTTIHSGRAFIGYKGKVTKDTAIEASAEALFNINSITFGMRHASAFEDTRLIGIASVVTSLSTRLSLNASFTAKFENFPAPLAKVGDLAFAPGFEPAADKLDTITKISLIFKFI